jgi:Uma2 family endonuclease
VLSPDTERFDRTGKFDAYRLLDSFVEYVLISQDAVRVEHYFLQESGVWGVVILTNFDQNLQLKSAPIVIGVDQLYQFTPFE